MSSKNSAKYERQKELARERQRRRRAKMTEEEKENKKKYDRERMAKLRADKVVKKIGDMTEREKRKQRKYWRERNKVRRQKEKALKEALANTPPQSPDEPHRESSQKKRGRKQVKRERAKAYRTVKKQEKQIKSLKKRLERYKKRLQREKVRHQNLSSPSPKKQVKDLLGAENVSNSVRRQLFLGFALRKQVEHQNKLIKQSKKKNQQLRKALGNKIIKKYRVQKYFQDILPYKCNKILKKNQDPSTYSRKSKDGVRKRLSVLLQMFFEQDNVSRMCPGKKDYIRKGSIKRQRRVLLHPLKELHKMFVNEHKCKLSLATFARARPFWVCIPKKSDRETCACIKHTNMSLLVSALHQTKVIAQSKPSLVLKEVTCSTENEACLMGTCQICKSKKIKFFYENDFSIKYFKWKKVAEEKVIKNKKRIVKRTMKIKVVKKVSKLKAEFVKELEDYKKHVCFAKHQIDAIKNKSENLETDELIFRIDFSENYITKMANEVQSFHFGASKRQLSLNTGVRYANDGGNVQSFCFATVSDNIDHQAHAIWAHMIPILQKSAVEYPNTKTIHFVSDSPSNQYRNRYNIHLFKTLVPQYFSKVQCMTWNYTEAGHGKGPMDGVGGTLKRLADSKVSYGLDITCATDFVDALTDCKICLIEVPSAEIENLKVEISHLKLAPINGIMKVHQFTFVNGTMYDARELTCFECPPSECCTHYKLRGFFPDITTSSAIGKKKQSSRNTSSRSNVECQQSTEPDVLSDVMAATSSKKHKLSVDVVYTSSEDDDEGQVEQLDQSVPLQEFIDAAEQNHEVCWENLQSGDYILVQYTTDTKKSNTQTFVGICQSSMCNNELDVMFMKPCKKDHNLYFVDENDRASVLKYQIVLHCTCLLSYNTIFILKRKNCSNLSKQLQATFQDFIHSLQLISNPGAAQQFVGFMV